MRENYMDKLSPIIDKVLEKKYRTVNIGKIGEKLTVMIFTECGWKIFAHNDAWIVANQIEEFLKGEKFLNIVIKFSRNIIH